jgi:hypothetical protein
LGEVLVWCWAFLFVLGIQSSILYLTPMLIKLGSAVLVFGVENEVC